MSIHRLHLTAMLLLTLLLAVPRQPIATAQTTIDDYLLEQKLTAESTPGIPDLEETAEFGSSVSMDGDTLVVGTPSKDEGGNFSIGAVYVYVRSGATWALQQKLTAESASGTPDLEEFARFGGSVSVDGNTLVVGTSGKDEGGSDDTGAVYVYTRSNGAWMLEQKLTAQSAPGTSDLEQIASFGRSVSVDGDTLVVGAVFKDEGVNTDAGAAYVYTRSGTTWAVQQKLTAESAPGTLDLEEFANFGWSVTLDGDTLVIGANGKDESGNSDAGAAYVYTRSGVTWTLQQKLIAQSDPGTPDLQENARFGGAVTLDGDTLVIGANGKEEGGNINAGAAYVYTRSSANWTLEQKLTAETAAGTPDLEAGALFGISVAVDGDTLVVGAFDEDQGSVGGAGVAYVYVRSSVTWAAQQKLAPSTSDLENRIFFSSSVAADGDTLVVGAQFRDEGGNENAGAVYVYRANPLADAVDVNGDGNITPTDAIFVINRIGQDPVTDTAADVDDDNDIDVIDANAVIGVIGQ